MREIARELNIPYYKLPTILLMYWPATSGRFSELRLTFGLTLYREIPQERMQKVPGGVLVSGQGGNKTFWRIPTSA